VTNLSILETLYIFIYLYYSRVNELFTMKHSYTLSEDVFSYIKTHRAVSTLELTDVFQKRNFTKQGVYKVLRTLKKEGKVLWTRQHVTINLLWLHREIESLARIFPERRAIFETFAKRQVYTMKTLAELDDVWGQIFASILTSLPSLSYALFYDLHNYTYIHKIPVVEEYIQLLYKKNSKICLLVGSDSQLDQQLRVQMGGVSVHLVPKKWNSFISVLGDFIIYNYVDTRVWKEIDAVFETKNHNEALDDIAFLSQKKGTYRIVVERDLAKAKAIKKYFDKYFILPQ